MVTENIRIVISERGARTVSRNIKNIGTSAKGAQGSVQLLSRALGLLGGALLVTGAVRTLASFSQAMSTVKAVSEATEEQFKSLTAAAEELGATTRFTATQAADGMTFLARAGFDANEVLLAIPDTLNLAVAGALDLANAADIASNVLKGFGLEAAETTRVVDVLAKTANSANTNVQQLGDAMSFAAPAAKAIGVSVELAAASIGVLSDAGVQATRAGTGMRQIFIKLLSPTKKARDTLKAMGLSVEDVNVQARGLIPVIETLRDKNIGLSQASALVGVRQATALLILKDSVGRLKELNEANINAAGTAKRVADVMDDNLNGALLRVKSAFESIIISLGKAGAEGSLRTILERIATLFRIIANNADILATALAALAAVITVKLVQGALLLLLGSLKKLGVAFLVLSARVLPLMAGAAISAFAILAAVSAATGKNVKEILTELREEFGALIKTFTEPVDTVNAFEKEIGKLLTTLEKVGGVTGLTDKQLKKMTSTVETLKDSIKERLLIQEFISADSQAVVQMTDQLRVLDKLLKALKETTKDPLEVVIRPSASEIAKTTSELRDLRIELLESKTDLASGFERGILKIGKEFEDMATLSENAVVNAFRGMEDALVQFVKTGKLDFKSLADSIITDLIRIQIRSAITGPLASLTGNLFKGGGKILSTVLGTAVGGGVGGAVSELNFLGAPFAMGGISNSPAIFGEAGPEAAVPLPDGRSIPVTLNGNTGNTIFNIDLRGSNGDASITAAVEKGIRQASPKLINAAVNKVQDRSNRT